jgi:hypothetical protein
MQTLTPSTPDASATASSLEGLAPASRRLLRDALALGLKAEKLEWLWATSPEKGEQAARWLAKRRANVRRDRKAKARQLDALRVYLRHGTSELPGMGRRELAALIGAAKRLHLAPVQVRNLAALPAAARRKRFERIEAHTCRQRCELEAALVEAATAMQALFGEPVLPLRTRRERRRGYP